MIFELMMTKKLKIMFKSLILFWIPVVVAVGFFCAIKITEVSIESIQPSADEIESVMIVDQNAYIAQSDYEVGLCDVEITSHDAKVIVSKALSENIDNYNRKLGYADYTSSTINVNYWSRRQMYKIEIKLKNGITITRNIKFSNEEREFLKYYVALESEEYKNLLIHLPAREEITRIDLGYMGIVLDPTDFRFDMLMDTFEYEFNELTEDEKIRYRVMKERYTDSNKKIIYTIVFYRDGKEYKYDFCMSEEYIPHTTGYITERLVY
jgi:hypothetical protein